MSLQYDTGSPEGRCRQQRGTALVIVLLATAIVSALGMAVALTVSTEGQIAHTFVEGAEMFHAADAAFEHVLQDLSQLADWNEALAGVSASSLKDGPEGPRVLADGSVLDLRAATAELNCGKPACTDADLDAYTAERPWGPNNPRWQIFAHGRVASVHPGVSSRAYVVVWVADDALETDGQPLRDGAGADGENPGAGLVEVRALAYGGRGSRRMIEGTVRRTNRGLQVLSWRERRR
jgi:hypothetical protein